MNTSTVKSLGNITTLPSSLSSLNTSSYKYDTYLIDISKIKKSIKKFGKKLINTLKRRKGHGELIFIAVLYFVIGYLLIAPPIAMTTKNLRFTLINSQFSTANNIGTALNSPTRNRIVDEIYKRVQNQLIQHLQLAGGSNQYQCQGQLTQPTTTDPVTGSTTGDLSYQYGLCNPETLLLGLDGDTNQSLNIIAGIYPDYQKVLSTPTNDLVRQSSIKDAQNNYNYTLRTTYVGEDVLSQGPSSIIATRFERYHYLIRADIEYFTYRYTKIRSPLVIYYDVFVLNSFYNSPFYGSGSACDEQPSYVETTRPDLVREADGSFHFYIDNPDDKLTGCVGSFFDGHEVMQCRLNSNSTAILFPSRAIRLQNGCASASTGIPGVTTPDPNGYGFGITVRTVSFGKPYS